MKKLGKEEINQIQTRSKTRKEGRKDRKVEEEGAEEIV
jgi:hypothetical protein